MTAGFFEEAPQLYSLESRIELRPPALQIDNELFQRHIMKSLILIIALLSSSIGFQIAYGATVIAHSVSTRQVARLERSFSRNDEVLVVCRSNLNYPLDRTYSSIDALNRDAASQLNITGSYFHVYSFGINSDGSVSQRRNKKYKAD